IKQWTVREEIQNAYLLYAQVSVTPVPTVPLALSEEDLRAALEKATAARAVAHHPAMDREAEEFSLRAVERLKNADDRPGGEKEEIWKRLAKIGLGSGVIGTIFKAARTGEIEMLEDLLRLPNIDVRARFPEIGNAIFGDSDVQKTEKAAPRAAPVMPWEM